MERLTIDEVIAHCKRHTERMESHSGRSQLEETPIGNSDIMKQYWEHRQVAEGLEELIERRRMMKKYGHCTDNLETEIKANVIDEAIETAAKAICIGCGYLDGHKCTYKGGNCTVSKPMLEVIVKALEQMKAGGENE